MELEFEWSLSGGRISSARSLYLPAMISWGSWADTGKGFGASGLGGGIAEASKD